MSAPETAEEIQADAEDLRRQIEQHTEFCRRIQQVIRMDPGPARDAALDVIEREIAATWPRGGA